MKKIIPLLAFIFLFSGCATTTQQTKEVILEKENCISSENNTWIEATSDKPAYCHYIYQDGDKQCFSSNECEGNCITNKLSQLGKEGHCAVTNDLQGCQTAIESDKIKCIVGDVIHTCSGDPSVDDDPFCEKYLGSAYFE